MSQDAYIYNRNERIIVHADSLGEKDRNREYFCPGICEYGPNKGEECGVRMFLVLRKSGSYFSVITGNHKKGCNNCHEGNTQKIVSLNRGCAEINDEGLLERLMDQAGRGGSGRDGGNKTTDDSGQPDLDDDDPDGPIEEVKRFPKNVGEIYELLEEFSVYDSFAGKQVSRWIVDYRTFNDYYRNGLKDGQIAVVEMRKYPPSKIPDDVKNLAAADNNYIFICSKASFIRDSDPIIFFLVPKESATQFYDEKGKQSTKFAVLAKWRPVEGIAHVYRPETPLSEKHVHPIPKDEK